MAKRETLDERDTRVASLAQNERQVAMQMAPFEAERERQLQLKAEQEQREKMIAQCHETIGRVQANMLMSKFADVGSFTWLKEIKENKSYRDLPNIGTWDKFCNYLGLSRSKVDEDLTNISVFGEAFLLMCRQFSLGYQDLRKLRQLTHEGTVTIEAETITIDGKAIPFAEDHAEDLQAAIENIIQDKQTMTKRLDKLEKDMTGIVKAEVYGIQAEKDALVKELTRLKQYDPIDKDRSWSADLMNQVRHATVSLEAAVQRFVIDPRMVDDRNLQAQVESHLRGAELHLQDLRGRFEDAFFTQE